MHMHSVWWCCSNNMWSKVKAGTQSRRPTTRQHSRQSLFTSGRVPLGNQGTKAEVTAWYWG
jgi:hypothetical protein